MNNAVYRMYIDGERVDSASGETFARENPYNGEAYGVGAVPSQISIMV